MAIGVSDRVAVMHEGRIAGVLERDQMSEAPSCRWRSASGCKEELKKKDLGLLLCRAKPELEQFQIVGLCLDFGASAHD